MKTGVREKAEALEDSAVAELVRVADQEIAVGGFAVKVILHAFGGMIDAAAGFRHGEEIDERAGGIGDGNRRRSAPERFQAEEAFDGNVVQNENDALRGRTFLDDAAGCENDGFVEKLLGQFPMVGGRPASDIALTKQGRDEHPGISHDLFVAGQVERHGNIEPMPDAPEPALFGPPREELRGAVPINAKGLRNNIYRHRFAGGAQHGGEPCAGGREFACLGFHDYILSHPVHVLHELNVYIYSKTAF